MSTKYLCISLSKLWTFVSENAKIVMRFNPPTKNIELILSLENICSETDRKMLIYKHYMIKLICFLYISETTYFAWNYSIHGILYAGERSVMLYIVWKFYGQVGPLTSWSIPLTILFYLYVDHAIFRALTGNGYFKHCFGELFHATQAFGKHECRLWIRRFKWLSYLSYENRADITEKCYKIFKIFDIYFKIFGNFSQNNFF